MSPKTKSGIVSKTPPPPGHDKPSSAVGPPAPPLGTPAPPGTTKSGYRSKTPGEPMIDNPSPFTARSGYVLNRKVYPDPTPPVTGGINQHPGGDYHASRRRHDPKLDKVPLKKNIGPRTPKPGGRRHRGGAKGGKGKAGPGK